MKRTIFLLIGIAMTAFCAMAQEKIDNVRFREQVWDYRTDNDAIRLKTGMPVIIDFYATWCGPCKRLAPELEALQKEYAGRIKIYKVDVDAETELSRLFGISAMPTLYFIDQNGNYKVAQGLRTRSELRQMIDTYLLGGTAVKLNTNR